MLPTWIADAAAKAAHIASEAGEFMLRALAWFLKLRFLPDGASPGILLIVGGLVTMGAITVLLFVVRSIPSDGPVRPKPRSVVTGLQLAEPTAKGYQGPRDEEFSRGRSAGSATPASTLDGVLDLLVETEQAEPRVLRSLPNLLRLRLHACRGCAGGVAAGGCAYECGFLEGALSKALRSNSVVVHEVACRGAGAPACDFEVWY